MNKAIIKKQWNYVIQSMVFWTTKSIPWVKIDLVISKRIKIKDDHKFGIVHDSVATGIMRLWKMVTTPKLSLQWRHNERDGISNHQRLDCLLNACSGPDQRQYQSPASLACVRGIHRWPMNSPHKEPVTRKTFPFDDVIICDGKRLSYRNSYLDLSQFSTADILKITLGPYQHKMSLLTTGIVTQDPHNS